MRFFSQIFIYYFVGTFELKSDQDVLKTILEQVPIDSVVVNFEIISVELLSQKLSRFRRSSEISDYLVTFEISLTVGEGFEVIEELSKIFGKIENFKPGSLLVTDQQSFSGEGEFAEFYYESKF